ncbi:MAG: lactonase family protein [Phycisphaerae bacterium]
MLISNGCSCVVIAVGAALAVAAAAGAAGAAKAPAAESQRFYVAGRARGKEAGIYRGRLDLATGTVSVAGRAAGAEQPSFLALHPGGRYVYLANAMREFRGEPGGALGAYRIDPASGDLTLLNEQPSRGTSTCHLTVDRTGRHLLAVNYGTGSVIVCPVADDGRLGEATAFIQHEGRSVDPRRQKGPHAHSVNLDAANRVAFVADLGLDKVMVYRFDAAAGTLAPHDPPWVATEPGAGPRHFAFHPSGRFAYVLNEMASSVTAMAYDAAAGVLTPLHTVTMLPEEFDGRNTGAEVTVHPSGRFVYASNRGHDSIAVFRVDEKTGRLTPAGHASTQGKRPRHFAIDPSGRFLLAANRDSNTIVAFRINGETGALEPTGSTAEVPGAICILMVPGR